MLSVFEIEELISKLSTVVSDLQINANAQLFAEQKQNISQQILEIEKQITNWNSVLNSVRVSTDMASTQGTSAFDAERILVAAVLNTYNQFLLRTQTGQDLLIFLVLNLLGPITDVPILGSALRNGLDKFLSTMFKKLKPPTASISTYKTVPKEEVYTQTKDGIDLDGNRYTEEITTTIDNTKTPPQTTVETHKTVTINDEEISSIEIDSGKTKVTTGDAPDLSTGIKEEPKASTLDAISVSLKKMILDYLRNLLPLISREAFNMILEYGIYDAVVFSVGGAERDSILGTNPPRWVDFYDKLEGACNDDLPAPNDDLNGMIFNQYPLSTKALFDTLCNTGFAGRDRASGSSPSDFNHIGGIEGGKTAHLSLLEFLKDSKNLITYSSNAPVALSWVSTVKNSVEYKGLQEQANDDSVELNIKGKGTNFFITLGAGTVTTNAAQFISKIGKNSMNSKSFTRTVNVFLGDSDLGNILLSENNQYLFIILIPSFCLRRGLLRRPNNRRFHIRDASFQDDGRAIEVPRRDRHLKTRIACENHGDYSKMWSQ